MKGVPSAGARIAGIEYVLPERRLTNDELDRAHPSWNMPDVVKRMGVDTRFIARPDETALDLGERAARLLLERTGDPGRIGALIFCTQTPDHLMPPNACLLQARLGLPTSVMAFDLTLACSGYVYGLALADSLIASAAYESVLLVTGDTYSRLISPEDRATVALFGDGAAATLLCHDTRDGLGPFVLGTDGSRGQSFIVPAGGARQARTEGTALVTEDRSGNRRSLEHIYMDGQAILAFVKRVVPRNILDVLERAGCAPTEVDLVVLHQASQMTSEYLQQALPFPKDRYFGNLAGIGNTVSSSIPICLRDAERAGRLRRGQRVLLAGFGVGLSWGACLVEW